MIDDLFAKQSEHLEAGFRRSNLLTTASKEGSGMKRTVISRSVDSTNPMGGVVWAPSGRPAADGVLI
jgi:hypothetical protein